MYTLLILLGAPSTVDIDQLGHEEFEVREATESKLRSAWPLAVGLLSDAAARSESPEVRARANRLLAPYRTYVHECEAAVILYGPPSDPVALFRNDMLRRYVHRQAVAAGCDWQARRLHPDADESWGGWWAGGDWLPWAGLACDLEVCRQILKSPSPVAPHPESERPR